MNLVSFDEYNLINNDIKKTVFFKIFLILLIIGIILIIYNFKFNVYEKCLLYNEDDNHYLLTSINNDFIGKKVLKINDKEYQFNIINEDEYVTMNNNMYKSLKVNIFNYESTDKYNNVFYLRKSKTLFEILFDFIGGGSDE